MESKDWKDLIDKDMPRQSPITDETIRYTLKEASRFRGSTRVSTGRIWTDREYEERRRRVLNKPLP